RAPAWASRKTGRGPARPRPPPTAQGERHMQAFLDFAALDWAFAAAGASPAQQDRSPFLQFVQTHWYFAWPMFAMSFVALGLLVWRILLNVNGNTDMNVFLPQLQESLE